MQGNNVKDYTLNDLKIRFLTLYPRVAPKSFDGLFQQIESIAYDTEVVQGYLKQASDRRLAFQLAEQALHVAEGREDGTGLMQLIQSYPDQLQGNTVTDSDVEFVTDDLQELYEATVKTPGLRWRLGSMNHALGSLRQGNFGFIFARPETGKTTILSSELTYMAQQLPEDRPAIWFNNEQAGKEVMTRIYQATLGLTDAELWGDIVEHRRKYHELIRGRLKLVDQPTMTKKFVERVCKAVNPGLIVFDQIDKIKGFDSDRNDLELKAIYQWARELAKTYGPTIGVCQAGGTGEGKKWLTMDDVDSSKTSKQGEADWILGIGATFDAGAQYLRYMHLSKNKLRGDPDTDQKERHGRWSCLICPEIARYRDFDDD